jgi:phage baseplate assembly protein W
MDSAFLGSGWDFPVGIDPDAGSSTSTGSSSTGSSTGYGSGPIRRPADGDASIRQSIWMILSTSPGERVMRPDFGCGLQDLVFGVNNAGTATAVATTVRDALAVWEPRIDVVDVVAVPDAAAPHVLRIEIDYQVRSTNSRFNLVYPFYLD